MDDSSHHVHVAARQTRLPTPARALAHAVRSVLRGEGVPAADISVAVVDDAEIHELNRRFLQHDYPTDVLSFPLESSPRLEGEIVISADTAERQAAEHDTSYHRELLMYAIHGALHLVGYDDHDPQSRAAMEGQQAHYLELAERPVGDPPIHPDDQPE